MEPDTTYWYGIVLLLGAGVLAAVLLHTTFAPSKKRPYQLYFDELGQLVQTTDPLGNTTTFGYDKVIQRRTSATDPTGATVTTTYTPAGRRASFTDGTGGKTTYTCDNRGNLATVVSPRGNVKGANPADFTTRYFYDFSNNLVRVRRAALRGVQPAGRPTQPHLDDRRQREATGAQPGTD